MSCFVRSASPVLGSGLLSSSTAIWASWTPLFFRAQQVVVAVSMSSLTLDPATAAGEGQRDKEGGAGGERGSRGRPDGIRALVHRYPERVSEPDRPRVTTAARLASQAPLARGAVVASLSAVVLGFTFVPQLLGLALAGLSLARREPGGRRPALLAVGVSLLLTVVWGVVLALLLKWWAASR